MPLKAQDLQTFEAYKKAIRAAASQIKDNTPFCLYSDVEIPDASKKAHTLRPFLVVGSPATAITPLLKDLHGGKKPLCTGFCSLESGKISLEAKSGAVNYGLFKSQATVFKDLLGKEILIPAPGGAAADPKAAAAAVETLKTPFGPFSYFSNETKAWLDEIGTTVSTFVDASDDVKGMSDAYKEAMNLAKKLPPPDEIMKQAKKADKETANAARQAKVTYTLAASFTTKLTELQENAKLAAQSVQTALKKIEENKLEDEAKELREEAERQKAAIEGMLKAFTTCLKLGSLLIPGVGEAVAAGEIATKAMEATAEIVDTLGPALADKSIADLLAQAQKCEEKAHELKLDIAEQEFKIAKSKVAIIAQAAGATMNQLNSIKDVLPYVGRAPMTQFDDSKGSFKFKDLKEVADRMAEARDLAKDAVVETRKAYYHSDTMIGYIGSGKWKVPKPDEGKRILQKMKDEAVKLGKQAGDTFKDAEQRIPVWQKLYADAQEALARAHA